MSHTVPGLVLIDHEVAVPLDHARPDGEQITVFAREVAALGSPPWSVLGQSFGGLGVTTYPSLAPEGLRADGERILSRLIDLVRDRA